MAVTTLKQPSVVELGNVVQLPPLPYTLHTRKTAIAINWFGILLSSCFIPVVLYYTLRYGTSLSETVIFAITSSTMGLFSLADMWRRAYLLLRTSDESRPLGTGRWSLDFFHINFLVNFVPITLFFSFACASRPPRLDLMALPLPYLMTFVSVQLVVFTLLSTKTSMRTLFRISSLPRGSAMRPPVYCIIEDVVAVNGGGGKQYRAALDERYSASPLFRKMLADLSIFWGVPGAMVGCVLLVLIGTIDPTVSYGLAWTVPWAWAGLWACLTIRKVQRILRKEQEEWSTIVA